MTSKRVFVVGVGMTKFLKPPTKLDYDDMGAEAAASAIKDAGLDYASIQAAACGYCYGDPTCGQRALYKLGLTGVPIVNVNNNCSTGSTALFVAKTFVQSGTDCVLAVGFEKMQPGNLTQKFEDTHQSPTAQHFDVMYKLGAPTAKVSPAMNQFTEDVLKLFACAQQEHMEKYSSKPAHYNQVSYKNHKQSTLNPLAVMNKELPLSFIEKSGPLCGPLLRAHACPVASGAAAAVVCSERFVKKHQLESRAVEIVAQSMVTDMPSSFQSSSFISLSGFDMAKQAAQNVFASSGVKPSQVGVVECHNCFSCNELFMYEALGFADIGRGGDMIESGQWVKGKAGGELFYLKGKNCRPSGVVFNPSGGLECKGHPIGATGLAQCCELNWQLRGMCGPRQVADPEYALQQNFGIGGAAVVTLYKRPEVIKSAL